MACGYDDSDDLIPEKPKRNGRPIRPMENPYAPGSKGHAPKCGECPKWHDRTSVCAIKGCHQAKVSPACKYGIVLIRAKRMADKRERTKAGKAGVK